jgi:hypothetical protein
MTLGARHTLLATITGAVEPPTAVVGCIFATICPKAGGAGSACLLAALMILGGLQTACGWGQQTSVTFLRVRKLLLPLPRSRRTSYPGMPTATQRPINNSTPPTNRSILFQNARGDKLTTSTPA